MQKIEALFDNPQKNNSIWPLLLTPLSYIYKLGIFLYHTLYSLRLAKTDSFSIPIVCVGNIRVGGTGKTPFVQKLLTDLHKKIDIGVISTGYKALGVSKKQILSCKDNRGLLIPACFCGDEPAMLQKRFPSVDFYICKDRKKALMQAITDKKKIVILDDGFQQRSIKKDIQIVMLDPDCDLKNTKFLPRGPLRDFPSRLAAANYVCLSYEPFAAVNLSLALTNLQPLTKAKILASRKMPYYIKGEWEGPLRVLRHKKIGLFCAIARASRFIQGVKNYQPSLKKTWILSDHAAFSEESLKNFSDRAKNEGAEFLLCTEKDYIKVQSIKTSLPKAYVEMQTEIIYGNTHYDHLVEQILINAKKN